MKSKLNLFLEKISTQCAQWTGSSWAFLLALVLTITWGVTGPVFAYSDGWQLVMNTISSISTFLMVFLLQRSQIKDSVSMQIKLNEIIAVLQGANNRLINIEDLSETEIFALRKRYQDLATKIQSSNNDLSTHSMRTGQPVTPP